MTHPARTGHARAQRIATPTSAERRPALLRAVGTSPAEFSIRAAEAGAPLTAPLAVGDLTVDLEAYVVTLGGETVQLSPRQVELLALFLAAPHKVWSREQLHWVCWGTRRGRAASTFSCADFGRGSGWGCSTTSAIGAGPCRRLPHTPAGGSGRAGPRPDAPLIPPAGYGCRSTLV